MPVLEDYWLQKIKNGDASAINTVLQCDAADWNLLLPVNIRGEHWVLIHVDIQHGKVRMFDSLDYKRSAEPFLNALCEIYKVNVGHEFVAEYPMCSKQQNGFDCGIFVCMFADRLVK